MDKLRYNENYLVFQQLFRKQILSEVTFRRSLN